MTYEKYAEIVAETDEVYVATIWTGPNYYIGVWDKASIDDYVAYMDEGGFPMSHETAIAKTHVSDIRFMCKTEDYSQELLNEWIASLAGEGQADGN